ncbi:glucose-6-phosphate dehydrogenase assembly protein OpcA [Nocardiopsis terrae]|uniref:Glucose-6-phosphate dehydrogenase assembly protein OpcA n=1 Tax=Nocardiopsis terrae TaxID=372655 RepID=A0ABR9HEU1_9ACTN|nr:glucose-6-phosphate dehydrogenase assembly protein OpcA [Nocardiopsis terrae]MBE1457540.1 glucose-6-phosphate dehydrogenase assembly protein OpcA [Nocardiopsis terrae]GHC85556.1 glucose-6-phosphate dehydrogenase assembly protein OpcA [Nocardiopsis terrae]
MTLYLPRTTTSQITEALMAERLSVGGGAMNMVLTLVIVTDEADHYDAVRAATEAGREHPSRVVALIRRDPEAEPAIDAEIRRPGTSGPGEAVLLRLYGPLGEHPDSVLTPLLVPDAPVVVWWPGRGPADPAADPVGRLAHRRITDALRAPDPVRDLVERVAHYRAGDTDLTWTRLTPWRSLLASAMDQPCGWVNSARVTAERDYPSAELLAAWLSERLEVPVERGTSDGPGLTEVRLTTDQGDITISRVDGRVATLSRTGQPDQTVALARRGAALALAEELRRLDADETYASAARHLEPLLAGSGVDR